MSVIWIVLIVVFAALVGFIVLQRRRPDEADKVAAALDAAFKSAKDKAKDAVEGKPKS